MQKRSKALLFFSEQMLRVVRPLNPEYVSKFVLVVRRRMWTSWLSSLGLWMEWVRIWCWVGPNWSKQDMSKMPARHCMLWRPKCHCCCSCWFMRTMTSPPTWWASAMSTYMCWNRWAQGASAPLLHCFVQCGNWQVLFYCHSFLNSLTNRSPMWRWVLEGKRSFLSNRLMM